MYWAIYPVFIKYSECNVDVPKMYLYLIPESVWNWQKTKQNKNLSPNKYKYKKLLDYQNCYQNHVDSTW